MTRSASAGGVEPTRVDLPCGVQLRVTGRAYPGGRRPFDHDWLHAELIVAAREADRGFRCSALFRADSFGEFAELCRDPEQLTIGFAPTEPFVVLEIRGAVVSLTARDVGTERVVLRSEPIDGPGRAALAEQFGAVAARFPPRGPIDEDTSG